jgi:hypothetical protein
MGDKPCVTIFTRASMSIARPDNAAGLPKRKLSWPYIPQIASGKTFAILNEALVKLTLRQSPI